MTSPARRIAWSVAALLTVSAVAAARSQERAERPDSFAALTSEVRQLRLAVEDLARTQTQTQALGVYLSAQQSRILQVAGRLETARRELDSATLSSQEIASRLAAVNEELSRATDAQERSHLEDAIRQFKMEQTSISMKLQQARTREADLSQAMQVEDSRWTDLISRLEQLLKK